MNINRLKLYKKGDDLKANIFIGYIYIILYMYVPAFTTLTFISRPLYSPSSSELQQQPLAPSSDLRKPALSNKQPPQQTFFPSSLDPQQQLLAPSSDFQITASSNQQLLQSSDQQPPQQTSSPSSSDPQQHPLAPS